MSTNNINFSLKKTMIKRSMFLQLQQYFLPFYFWSHYFMPNIRMQTALKIHNKRNKRRLALLFVNIDQTDL